MVILPIRRHLVMSGDVFACHNWGSVTGIWWIEARKAVKPPTMPRTARVTKIYLPQMSMRLRETLVGNS